MDNGRWRYGHFYTTKLPCKTLYYIREKGECGGELVHPETICEATGYRLFNTKKGKKTALYENDVIRTDNGSHYIVKYTVGGFHVVDRYGEPQGSLYNMYKLFNPEPVVIGNIFDSIDLRKEFENVQ